MPSINLAPGTQYIISARKRRVRLYAIAILIVGIFALAWAGLYMYQASLTKTDEGIQQKIRTADAQIQTLHNEAVRVALFEKRLGEVKNLLDNHVRWNPIFTDLERLLPSDTVITNFDATSDSPTITVQGVTAQMDQVSVAVASLTAGGSQPSVFTGGSVKSIQRQESPVEGQAPTISYLFTLTLAFDPKILWQ